MPTSNISQNLYGISEISLFFVFLNFPGQHHSSSDYPSPDISVGPPIHPPQNLLPYLYPHGLYPGASVANPLLTTSSLFGAGAAGHPAGAMNPSLLFNAQLALASQNPFFSHFHALNNHQQHQQNHSLKAAALASSVHRFAPYSLPIVPPNLVNSSSLGSAFDAVLPSLSNRGSSPSSPGLQKIKSPSLSPKSDKSLSSPQQLSSATANSTLNELKSMEKMVNGLESTTTTATVAAASATTNNNFRRASDDNNISVNDVNGNSK